MSKKKSLGHNPLAYSMLGKATFDFIGKAEEESTEENQKKKKVNKKIVSYYLEEPLVKELKKQAVKAGISYSQFVSEAIKDALIDGKE